jgi:hypothetical protein
MSEAAGLERTGLEASVPLRRRSSAELRSIILKARHLADNDAERGRAAAAVKTCL